MTPVVDVQAVVMKQVGLVLADAVGLTLVSLIANCGLTRDAAKRKVMEMIAEELENMK